MRTKENRRVGYLLSLIAMFTLVACTPTSQDTTAEARAGIEGTNAAFMVAWAAGDAEGVAACYTEDASLLPPNAGVVDGRSAIAEFWAGGIVPGGEGILETLEVEGHGATAHEVGRFTITDADGGLLDTGSYVVVWKRRDGEWKLHRDIWNSDQPLAVASDPGDAMLEEEMEE